MNDLDFQEQAQLGLKYIEDAVVNLLTRHANGLTDSAIAEALGLGVGLTSVQRLRFTTAILELLVSSGRILRDGESNLFKDNPDRS